MNAQSIVNYCKSLSYFELENFAGQNFNIVYDYIKTNKSHVNPNDVLIPTIFTCIAVDGKLSETEWKFIMTFIGGYSYDEAFSTAGEFYCVEAQDTVRKFVDAFPYSVKEAYIKMCIAVLCVDHETGYDERCFLNSLI
ncbi:MAG: hypothetical protein IKT32_06205 [Clostridia bacterium]|nr:hypothetical protein [Clostridia bacterium]